MRSSAHEAWIQVQKRRSLFGSRLFHSGLDLWVWVIGAKPAGRRSGYRLQIGPKQRVGQGLKVPAFAYLHGLRQSVGWAGLQAKLQAAAIAGSSAETVHLCPQDIVLLSCHTPTCCGLLGAPPPHIAAATQSRCDLREAFGNGFKTRVIGVFYPDSAGLRTHHGLPAPGTPSGPSSPLILIFVLTCGARATPNAQPTRPRSRALRAPQSTVHLPAQPGAA